MIKRRGGGSIRSIITYLRDDPQQTIRNGCISWLAVVGILAAGCWITVLSLRTPGAQPVPRTATVLVPDVAWMLRTAAVQQYRQTMAQEIDQHAYTVFVLQQTLGQPSTLDQRQTAQAQLADLRRHYDAIHALSAPFGLADFHANYLTIIKSCESAVPFLDDGFTADDEAQRIEGSNLLDDCMLNIRQRIGWEPSMHGTNT
ncbi:MAG TPA: hypothetical protein VGD58_17380 [Herpetosiphonaceae bacterium]